jgi:two-component system chemotaxis sensor kinase CheA
VSESQDDPFREMFFEEARELLEALEQGLNDPALAQGDRTRIDRVYRAIHSLKGAAGMVGLVEISSHALTMEKALGQVRTGQAPMTDEFLQAFSADRERLEAMIAGEEGRYRGTSS